MSGIEIKTATLRSLFPRSNQLSYAAAKNQCYLLYKQAFSDKSIHNRQQSFLTHLHKIVTVFKKSTQNSAFFTSKKQKVAQQLDALPKDPRFSCTTVTQFYQKNTRRLKLHFFEWIYQALWSALLFILVTECSCNSGVLGGAPRSSLPGEFQNLRR